MKRWWPLAVLAASVLGCAHIDYIGENYAPTTQVDVYYSEENVPRAYTVIGEVIATGDDFVSTGKLQDEIKKEAMKRGADAVVLTGLEHVTSGENTSWTEDQTESKDKKGHTHVTTSGGSNTSTEEKKKIRAIFVRYKPTDPAN